MGIHDDVSRCRLSSHSRTRKILFAVGSMKRSGQLLGVHQGEVSTPKRTSHGRPRYVGLVCASVDAVLDVSTMWDSLESLVAETSKQVKSLESSRLAAAIAIKTKDVSSSNGEQSRMASVATVLANDHSMHDGASRPESPLFVIRKDVEIREGANGRGLYATKDIPAGVTLLVERPAASILDVEMENDGPDWADAPGGDSVQLAQRVAAAIATSSHGKGLVPLMASLHPKEGAPLPERSAMQADDDDDDDASEDDAELLEQMNADLRSAFKGLACGKSFAERMEAVCRLNGLGYYTNSEQLCYSNTYRLCTGTGLCLLASALNHSCAPNVSRFAIGDVLLFRTNTDIRAGSELQISYIEAEILCEHRRLRRQALNRDFVCHCEKCVAEDRVGDTPQDVADEEKNYLTVDSELQSELATMPQLRRAEICQQLLRGELPEEFRDGVPEDAGNEVHLRLKDRQEVRAVLGFALMQSGRFKEAWAVWIEAAQLAAVHCPPYDESIVVYAVQACLCAAISGEEGELWAKSHLPTAAVLHNATFGFQDSFFHQRFSREVDFISGHVPGDTNKDRQRKLWSDVLKNAQSKNSLKAPLPASWPAMRKDIMKWSSASAAVSASGGQAGKQAPSKQIAGKKRSSATAMGQSAMPIKQQPQVVNGLRVLG